MLELLPVCLPFGDSLCQLVACVLCVTIGDKQGLAAGQQGSAKQGVRRKIETDKRKVIAMKIGALAKLTGLTTSRQIIELAASTFAVKADYKIVHRWQF